MLKECSGHKLCEWDVGSLSQILDGLVRLVRHTVTACLDPTFSSVAMMKKRTGLAPGTTLY